MIKLWTRLLDYFETRKNLGISFKCCLQVALYGVRGIDFKKFFKTRRSSHIKFYSKCAPLAVQKWPKRRMNFWNRYNCVIGLSFCIFWVLKKPLTYGHILNRTISCLGTDWSNPQHTIQKGSFFARRKPVNSLLEPPFRDIVVQLHTKANIPYPNISTFDFSQNHAGEMGTICGPYAANISSW